MTEPAGPVPTPPHVAEAPAAETYGRVEADGTVWAWGANSSGKLGDGTTTDRNAPVQVGGLTNVIAIASGDLQSFEYGMGALLGIQAQGTAKYNYLVDGTVIPQGAPVVRNFVNHEGELYAQYTWKVSRTLTLTAGIRFSIEPPVYEANGQQASTNIPIADWLAQRMNLADQGLSQNGVTPITFIPESAGRPMYPSHHNWAPRAGIAYSPKGDSGLSKFLFGGSGKTSIRAGGGMYYDLIGQPLAQSFSSSPRGSEAKDGAASARIRSADADRRGSGSREESIGESNPVAYEYPTRETCAPNFQYCHDAISPSRVILPGGHRFRL